MAILKYLIRIINTISDYSGRATAILVLPLIAIICYSVVSRYFFNSPVSWSFELGIYIFTAQLTLSAAYGLSHGLHVKMDLLYSIFSKRTKAIIDLVTSTAFFFLVGLLLWQSSIFAMNSFLSQEHSPSAWQPLLWPVKACFPLGCFLLLLQGFAKFICDLYLALTGDELNWK